MAIFLNKYQHYLIYALILWILLGIYYGDVMYVAQQNSFFSTEGILMNFLTSHYPYGYLWYIGRGFLQLFYYPLLGSALYTFILISISILLSYVFNLKGRWKVLQFIPGLLWIAFLFFQGFNIYYQHETGKIIGIPFCILIILTLQSLFIRTFNKRTIGSALIIADTEKKRNLFNNILLVLVSSLLIIGNEIYRPYVRPTVKMQKALQNEDWETMIRTAKDCDVIVRPIAAYYAIALMQTGQITQSLFDIDFNYSEIYLHDRNGDKDYGAVRIRGFGNYSFKVDDAYVFMKNLSGTNTSFNTNQISDYLRSMVVSGISDAIGESKISVLDMAANLQELSKIVEQKMEQSFKSIGLKLTNFVFENFSLPEELEKALDKNTTLGMLRNNMDVYTQMETLAVMKEAAKNPGSAGGTMGAGMGLGMGMGIGNIFASNMQQMAEQQSKRP